MSTNERPLAEVEAEQLKNARESLKTRADKIVKECQFGYTKLSAGGQAACSHIEALFKEIVGELSMILPSNFRTAECLTHLEAASMWAKKSIATHDTLMQEQKKETNGVEPTGCN